MDAGPAIDPLDPPFVVRLPAMASADAVTAANAPKVSVD